MTSAEIDYLQNVLGVSSFVCREGMAFEAVSLERNEVRESQSAIAVTKGPESVDAAASVVPNIEKSVCVISPRDLSNDEQALVVKMLQSVQISNPEFVSISEEEAWGNFIAQSGENVRCGFAFGVSFLKRAEFGLLELPDIRRFFDVQSPDTVVHLKRQTWQKLLAFKDSGFLN